jgi:hypothetical protein
MAWHAALDPPRPGEMRYHEITAERGAEARAKGYALRHFFPHRFYCLPKCGPDGFKLAQRMCGTSDPSACWEIVLYAAAGVIEEFSADLFFDDELVWHQQQFGRVGQIATADLVLDGTDLFTMVHIADLVQRISRRRQYKTRVETKFRGWHHMLLNSIANFALEHRVTRVFSPRAEFALRHIDPRRTVQRELFERIYDRDVRALFPEARPAGPWWVLDAGAIAPHTLIADRRSEPLPAEKTVCITHDIERGLGSADRAFAATAEQTSAASLAEMLAIEREANLRATYNVVGVLLEQVRPQIEADAHCLAFHSYDHRVAGCPDGDPRQLRECRRIDYRLKGYRAPRSLITAELSAPHLCAHNFEWLASGAASLRVDEPEMAEGLVRIPILFDDFPLHTRRMTYPEWEEAAIEMIRSNHFAAFGLHDCYAPHWLPHYRRFLNTIRGLGRLRTLDEVAADVIMRNAR